MGDPVGQGQSVPDPRMLHSWQWLEAVNQNLAEKQAQQQANNPKWNFIAAKAERLGTTSLENMLANYSGKHQAKRTDQ